MKIEQFLGRRFGKLLVERYVGLNKRNERMWICRCDCGNIKVAKTYTLTSGGTTSCGCVGDEVRQKFALSRIKHGEYTTKLYHCWEAVKQRCFNPKSTNYSHYGGRGITVCDEWKNDYTVFRDWALDNGFEEHLTLERIDVNGNYEPDNCTWITQQEQGWNKRNTVRIHGKNLRDLSKITGLTQDAIRSRLNRGWDKKDAVSIPKMDPGSYHKTNRLRGFEHPNAKHLGTRTKLYHIWNYLKLKCPEWQEFAPFREWAVAQGYQEGMLLDCPRDDVAGPHNSKFVTKAQYANSKAKKIQGRTIKEWSEILGISKGNLYNKLRYGEHRTMEQLIPALCEELGK